MSSDLQAVPLSMRGIALEFAVVASSREKIFERSVSHPLSSLKSEVPGYVNPDILAMMQI